MSAGAVERKLSGGSSGGYSVPTHETRQLIRDRAQPAGRLPGGYVHVVDPRSALARAALAKKVPRGALVDVKRIVERKMALWQGHLHSGARAYGRVQVVASSAKPTTAPEGLSVQDKWNVARSESAEIALRIDALRDLILTDPEGVATFVASELETAGDTPWHRALVFVAERVKTGSAATRTKLMLGLRAHALLFRDAQDAGADPPLWAALRRYSSLIPVSDVTSLLDFLRSEDRPKTRQTALQGLQNILSVESLPDGSEMSVLRSRVAELTAKYLDEDFLGSAENAAMALNCYCVAVLVDADAKQLTNRLLNLNRAGLVASAASRILRRCVGPEGPPSIEQVLDRLSQSPAV